MARVALGALAFLAITAIGIALAYFIVRAIPQAIINPTEAYVGDGLLRFYWFCFFGFASLVAGAIVGLHVAAPSEDR